MDTKVIIDLICVHCGTVIQIQKKKNQPQCKLTCPACKKNLHVLFDLTKDPQTYPFISIAQSNKEENHSGGTQEKDSKQEEKEKVNKNKTIYKKNHDRAKHYDGIPGEDDEKDVYKSKTKTSRLREPIFLTRKKFLGLVAERYKLSEGTTIVGRDDDDEPSDISLRGDDTISRRSISISIIADEYGFDYIMKVLNAANPVRLNGKPLREGEKVFLDLGDVITIGHTDLKFDNR